MDKVATCNGECKCEYCAIPLYHILDGNDCATSDRVCTHCMGDAIEEYSLEPGERVVESGRGRCAWCGEGGCEEE